MPLRWVKKQSCGRTAGSMVAVSMPERAATEGGAPVVAAPVDAAPVATGAGANGALLAAMTAPARPSVSVGKKRFNVVLVGQFNKRLVAEGKM